jgi:small subunit ribosomal protein S4
MSEKRPTSKGKIDRRLGANIWGRAKSPFNKRQYGPGQHGPNRRGKTSDYGKQLIAKQRLKGHYGNIGEKQFRRYYAEAVRLRGDTSENLIGLLECRLDAVVYRSKLVPTVFAARQLVSHKHFTVNGKVVNIGSYMVQEGDVVQMREKGRKIPAVQQAIESGEREFCDYIETNVKDFTAKLIRRPKLADVPYAVQMEPNLVIEFYSR